MFSKFSLKSLASALVLSAVLCMSVVSSRAQLATYGYQSLSSFTCSTNFGTNVANVISCGKMQNVGIQLTYICDKASTNTVTAYITRSVDGITYEAPGTNVAFNATATTPGTTVSIITYLSTLGSGYMKINYWTNTALAGALITNGVASYGVRIQAP